MARVTMSGGLDERIAAQVLAPQVTATTEAIAADVRLTGPQDTGLLRMLAEAERTLRAGTRVHGRATSTRPSEDGRHDVAAYVEFGTRYMTPRRYMAASTRRVITRRGVGRFSSATDPWPHK